MQGDRGMSNAAPTIIVIFGGTGDLARKKLLPSLIDLYVGGYLPSRCHIVSFSRRSFSDDEYHSFVHDVLKTRRHTSSKEMITDFLRNVSYVSGDFNNLADYAKLSQHLRKIDKAVGQCTNKLLYLAVPPKLYASIFASLKKSKLSEPCSDEAGWARVLVEKPFGSDLNTAQELDRQLCATFKEEQIFRIDHYLAKDAVQNVLTFRFSNRLLENSWSGKYIERVRIRLLEDYGVEERAEFYDGIGALRDMGQSHVLQMLALCAMEDPEGLSASVLRTKRADILRSLKTYRESSLSKHVVRGQYSGYRDIDGVTPWSNTSTYFLLKAFVKKARWKGVPFYLEHGKRLNETRADITVWFRPKLPCVCGKTEPHGHQNKLIITIKPQFGIHLTLWVKKPGFSFELEEQTLSLHHEAEKGREIDAYEKILYDCIMGDQTLFTSGDEVQAAWSFITPILEHWDTLPLLEYEKGAAGPVSDLQQEVTNEYTNI